MIVQRTADGHAEITYPHTDGKPVADHVDHDLQDRSAEPGGARTADDEPRPLAVQHDRRRHHARQAGARPVGAPLSWWVGQVKKLVKASLSSRAW